MNIAVFDLTGHLKAKQANVWADQAGRETHFAAALELPPVDSIVTALRTAVASKARK